ncbi:MAG: methyltransferase domain-containing protein [Acidobacteria bacterium]|nr:methyltransferase domain-containing protein [Acidobacteriota bacterium]
MRFPTCSKRRSTSPRTSRSPRSRVRYTRKLAEAQFDQAYFERMAALEDAHPWTRSMRTLTLSLLKAHGLRQASAVLDAGCGTGLLLRDFRDTFAPSLEAGIDFAWPALPVAAHRTSALLAGASADALPFRDGSFDAVHSADVLQHMTIAGALEAMREFRRVLKPGGLAALRLRATRRFIPNAPDVDFDHAYSETSLRSSLSTVGFQVLFLRRVNVLPSLAAELTYTPPDPDAPVKGIALRSESDARGKVLSAYLAFERGWLRAGLPTPGVGHTLLTIAKT